MPPHGVPDSSRPRRDPLSCQSCRTKKLRCDRQKPCGNCRSRRLQCEYYGERAALNVPPSVSASDVDLYAQNAELKARIERLERATFGESPSTNLRHSQISPDFRATPASGRNNEEATVDSRWLEGVGSHFVEADSHTLDFQQITVHSSNDFMFSKEYLPRTRPVSLPSRGMALECLNLYEVHIDIVHPVLHVPSWRDALNAVYDKLERGHCVPPGSAALILIICACVSLWKLHGAFPPSSSDDSAEPSEVLATQALFAVDNAHVLSQSSIEAVQASILLCFHFCHVEGFSPHAQGLHARTLTMARSLGLHRIDASSSMPRGNSQAEIIKIEVGRKVWWHLAATDWLFGYTGGIHEGSYSINPQHIAVHMPRNLNHEDLSVCDSTFARPDDEPTIMAYYLQRLKLAIICRDIIDALPGSPISLSPQMIPYDKIVSLDTKFCELVATLPKLFELDQTEGIRVQCGKASTGAIWLIRTTIHLFLHARRCKLHLPYLLRVKSDPRYAYSREICLKSARRAFEAREQLHAREPTGTFIAFFHLGGTLIHVFYAAMVLVMDLCVNSEEGQRDQSQIAEVQHAIKIMEDARASSQFVTKFLDSLMQVLRKHQVNLPATEQSNGSLNGERLHGPVFSAGSEAQSTLHQNQTVSPSSFVNPEDRVMSGDDDLENVWQDLLYNGASLDLQSWDALINDLEMRFE